MGQGGEPRIVQGQNQEARGDGNGFRHIIIAIAAAIGALAAPLAKDTDQPGCCFQKRFGGIRANGFKGGQPFLPRPAIIKLPLLRLRALANGFFS
jgi:hypothetical protein